MGLGMFSRETFSLWHTAINWLRGQGRFNDMVAVSERLRVRLEPLCPGFDYSHMDS